MIQFVAAAAIGAVGLYAYSSFKKHWAEIKRKEELEKAKKPKTLGDLEQDPENQADSRMIPTSVWMEQQKVENNAGQQQSNENIAI